MILWKWFSFEKNPLLDWTWKGNLWLWILPRNSDCNKSSTWQIPYRPWILFLGRETPKHPECGMNIQNTLKASSSRDPKVHQLNLPLRNNTHTHHRSKDSDRVRPQKTSPKWLFFLKAGILSGFKGAFHLPKLIHVSTFCTALPWVVAIFLYGGIIKNGFSPHKISWDQCDPQTFTSSFVSRRTSTEDPDVNTVQQHATG